MTETDSEQFGTVIHQGCGGAVQVEIEIRGNGYQPRFYYECQECCESGRWNPGGWS